MSKPKPMRFDKLHRDTECECVDKLPEPRTDVLLVRDFCLEDLPGDWFNSDWEGGARDEGEKQGDCVWICGLKAVSLRQQPLEDLFAYRYSRTYAVSHKRMRSHYCVLRINKGAGRLKTPKRRTNHHRGFLKSDHFRIELHLEIVEIGKYADVET